MQTPSLFFSVTTQSEGNRKNARALQRIRVGCAGWSIPGEHSATFPREGSHLERYAGRFSAVEINSSFYRPHRAATYARWAASTPENFRVSVKMPREITHQLKLSIAALQPLDRFLGECGALGSKLGPILIQLPPSLDFDEAAASRFLEEFRNRYRGPAVCEPRDASYFADAAEEVFRQFEIGRVATDPAVVSEAAVPGGWDGIVYYRLHGSPRMYYSAYSDSALTEVAAQLSAAAERSAKTWCIFDNTAAGAAIEDALKINGRITNEPPA